MNQAPQNTRFLSEFDVEQIVRRAMEFWTTKKSPGQTDSRTLMDSEGSHVRAATQEINPDSILWRSVSGPQVITAGLPFLSADSGARWIGRRLVVWHQGIPSGRCVAVASSRLPRRLDREQQWFDLLRTCSLHPDPIVDCMVIVHGTAAAAAARQAALLFGIPFVEYTTNRTSGGRDFSEQSDLAGWLTDLRKPAATAADWSVEVSREFQHQIDCVRSSTEPVSLTNDTAEPLHVPLSDRLLFAAAQRIYVLKCDPDGNVSRAIKAHVLDQSRSSVMLFLAEPQAPPRERTRGADKTDSQSIGGGRPPVNRPPVNSLLSAPDRAPVDSDLFSVDRDRRSSNLVRWMVAGLSSTTGAVDGMAPVIRSASAGQPSAYPSEQVMHRVAEQHEVWLNPDEWLSHWTRSRPGPWPGQTQDEWLDELILGCDSADHSAIATLLRIVAGGRIAASATGIRGGWPVVAWTAVPLSEFRRRRVFRSHRHRYDFEPWGIAVRRTALLRLGARPVRYGDEQDWDGLPESERAWFQKQSEDSKATDNRAEHEWRVFGDVDLSVVENDDACVFVSTAVEQRLVAAASRWPVITLPDLNN